MFELGKGKHACAHSPNALLGLSSPLPAGGAHTLARAVKEQQGLVLALTLGSQESDIKQDPRWKQQALGS